MTHKPKPCPWCNKNAHIEGCNYSYISDTSDKRVGCDTTNCYGNPDSGTFDTEEEAVDAWNIRAYGWLPIDKIPDEIKDGEVFSGWVTEYNKQADTLRNYWEPKCRYSPSGLKIWHSHGWFGLNLIPWIERTLTHWMPIPLSPKDIP